LFCFGFIFPFGTCTPGTMRITLNSPHHTDQYYSMDDCVLPPTTP
jgi:hypothetical protein